MKRNLRGKKAGDTIAQVVIWTILVVSLIIFSVPFLFMITNSFEQFSFVLPYPPKLIPTQLDFSAYKYVLSQPFFPTAVKNSVINTSITVVLSVFIGLKSENILGFFIAFGFMALIGIAFTAFGIAIASKMEDMTGFQLIMNFVVFPIFGLSGALFPISSLPPFLAPITLFDPLTYGVEGIRYGLTGVSQINPLVSLVVLGGFTIATTVIGAYLFRTIKI
ncbi:MAG: hypothetical protein CVV33_06010 [Methanomicrobiales archaeon HGW-Methanomicrobiales-4]|nr:MAG: hypothetical protein CVV33_06010 [Methanomicrobiales archaeon HGW-Methanomicrobiales-4]